MNNDDLSPSAQTMPDVQSYRDSRSVDINRVGIKRIRVPVMVTDHGAAQHTVAEFSLSVFLPQDRKGTHMSRFAQLLNDYREQTLGTQNFADMFQDMLTRLDSNAGTLSMSFTFFLEKKAPVSELPGMMDYGVTLTTRSNAAGETETRVKLDVPVTTLCPCSKEISNYGAHSQRSIISIDALVADTEQFCWRDTIESAEQQASAQLYSQLKRADEKYVTEHAYDNPRFVEDLIREVATVLNANTHKPNRSARR
ncbi:MAG: GTP cyclohydrolase FolE2 [Pseudomonadota bacterium]